MLHVTICIPDARIRNVDVRARFQPTHPSTNMATKCTSANSEATQAGASRDDGVNDKSDDAASNETTPPRRESSTNRWVHIGFPVTSKRPLDVNGEGPQQRCGPSGSTDGRRGWA